MRNCEESKLRQQAEEVKNLSHLRKIKHKGRK
jgi:hypothetical protein